MDRQEILLKEYEVCQQDSNAMASVHWTVVGILMGAITAVSGWVVYSIIINKGTLDEDFRYIVLALGVAVILIIICLSLWLNRVNHLIHVNELTMDKIADRLKMEKKDKITPCPFQRWWQFLLFFLFFLWYIPPKGAYIVKGIYLILILLWAFFISVALCPVIRAFIFGSC